MPVTQVFASYIFPVAMTLAFAIPPPWGVFASGGIQILQEIFGSFGSQGSALENTVKALLTQAVAAISDLLKYERVIAARSSINTFLNWMATEADTLKLITPKNGIHIVSRRFLC